MRGQNTWGGSETPWDALGDALGRSEHAPGRSGTLWGALGRPGTLWARLEKALGRSGKTRNCSGTLLGTPWDALRTLWGALGRSVEAPERTGTRAN